MPRFLRSLTGRKLNFQNLLIFLLLLGGLIAVLNIAHLLLWGGGREEKLTRQTGPSYALHGRSVDSGYLRHVVETFSAFGLERVGLEDGWDVLWSHDYPFRRLSNLLPKMLGQGRRLVNHFPGSGYITNKMELASSTSPFLPQAFSLPAQKEELLAYAKAHPSARFVLKSNNHRGISILQGSSLHSLHSNASFVQEFVQNPLLVDGHKFDIGVYTVLTSLAPLRLYIYNDVLFRFCPIQYHPFDEAVQDKYVVGDDYLPIWKLRSLSKSYNDLGFSMKDTFNLYYDGRAGRRRNSSHIWSQVEAAISATYLAKEEKLIESARKLGFHTKHFFELVRFDFVVDEDGGVWLMEANMSPNLSSAHFPPNQQLYRQVLLNLFRLVGIGATPPRSTSDRSQVSDKHLAVYGEECGGNECLYDCGGKCALCAHCLEEEQKEALREAYLDEVNKGDFTRIFPSTTTANQDKQGRKRKLNKWNSLEEEWYRGKCRMDSRFC